VRFEVARCGGAGAIGSGFELSPSLVATAAHVVEDGQVIRVIQGTTSTAGTIVGIDPGADVALIETTTPLSGHAFIFSDSDPRVGDQIAAIGFPRGEPLAFNTGTVNGVGRKSVIDGVLRHDLLEMDAAITHGNSGGPVIRSDGAVVGLVESEPGNGDQGRRMAVSSAIASPLIDAWTEQPHPTTADECTDSIGPNGDPVPAGPAPTRAEMQSVATLDVYFRAVNGGDFPTALAQLVHPPSLESFKVGVTSSQDSDIRYRTWREEGAQIVLWVTFTSEQEAGKGPAERPQETCTDWSLDYVMSQKNGLWLIEATRPHGPGNAPCA
jgi:hypothetical protein